VRGRSLPQHQRPRLTQWFGGAAGGAWAEGQQEAVSAAAGYLLLLVDQVARLMGGPLLHEGRYQVGWLVGQVARLMGGPLLHEGQVRPPGALASMQQSGPPSRCFRRADGPAAAAQHGLGSRCRRAAAGGLGCARLACRCPPPLPARLQGSTSTIWRPFAFWNRSAGAGPTLPLHVMGSPAAAASGAGPSTAR
jgi:hypothetical protein